MLFRPFCVRRCAHFFASGFPGRYLSPLCRFLPFNAVFCRLAVSVGAWLPAAALQGFSCPQEGAGAYTYISTPFGDGLNIEFQNFWGNFIRQRKSRAGWAARQRQTEAGKQRPANKKAPDAKRAKPRDIYVGFEVQLQHFRENGCIKPPPESGGGVLPHMTVIARH